MEGIGNLVGIENWMQLWSVDLSLILLKIILQMTKLAIYFSIIRTLSQVELKCKWYLLKIVMALILSYIRNGILAWKLWNFLQFVDMIEGAHIDVCKIPAVESSYSSYHYSPISLQKTFYSMKCYLLNIAKFLQNIFEIIKGKEFSII